LPNNIGSMSENPILIAAIKSVKPTSHL
jgi:hypothetical protein